MLENAIRACPDELVERPFEASSMDQQKCPGFWYVAYHTLFFLDYDLSGSEREFRSAGALTLAELDPAGVLPERPYTKDELLAYLAHGREKCRSAIEVLTDDAARKRCGFERREMSVAELLIHSTRHVQHLPHN